jgi:hypothetical protein
LDSEGWGLEKIWRVSCDVGVVGVLEIGWGLFGEWEHIIWNSIVRKKLGSNVKCVKSHFEKNQSLTDTCSCTHEKDLTNVATARKPFP